MIYLLNQYQDGTSTLNYPATKKFNLESGFSVWPPYWIQTLEYSVFYTSGFASKIQIGQWNHSPPNFRSWRAKCCLPRAFIEAKRLRSSLRQVMEMNHFVMTECASAPLADIRPREGQPPQSPDIGNIQQKNFVVCVSGEINRHSQLSK